MGYSLTIIDDVDSHRRQAATATPRTTNTISGYRYYSPSTGRWVCRDPLYELRYLMPEDLVRAMLLHTLCRDRRQYQLLNALDSNDAEIGALKREIDRLSVAKYLKPNADYAVVDNNPCNNGDAIGLSEVREWQKKCEDNVPRCDGPMSTDEYLDCLFKRKEELLKCISESKEMLKACLMAVYL